MECAFLRVGDNEPCHSKPTKKSIYCKMHNFLIKTSKVKPCLQCPWNIGQWHRVNVRGGKVRQGQLLRIVSCLQLSLLTKNMLQFYV